MHEAEAVCPRKRGRNGSAEERGARCTDAHVAQSESSTRSMDPAALESPRSGGAGALLRSWLW
jgi:hypothetical protein